MKTRSSHYAAGFFVAACALALPGATSAQQPGFSYLELNYVNVDVDYSETLADDIDTLSIKTDADAGFQLAGAWEFGQHWHVFVEYSQADQDLVVSGTFGGETFSGTGSFDLVRYRAGTGYSYQMSESSQLYGRLSFDGIEVNDFALDGDDLGDTDDTGVGAELGFLWAATPRVHVQAHTRYSSVGKLETDGNDEFGTDLLFGLSGRWYFNDTFALQAGYEVGDISTWRAGVRLSF